MITYFIKILNLFYRDNIITLFILTKGPVVFFPSILDMIQVFL